MRTLFTSFVVLSSLVASAATSHQSQDHSEVWVMTAPPGLSVKLNSDHRIIDITLPGDESQLPPSIGVTLFSSDGGQTFLELKSVDPSGGASGRGDYSGVLSPAAQSVMGFEIRIPFGEDSSTTLKSEDMVKLNP